MLEVHQVVFSIIIICVFGLLSLIFISRDAVERHKNSNYTYDITTVIFGLLFVVFFIGFINYSINVTKKYNNLIRYTVSHNIELPKEYSEAIISVKRDNIQKEADAKIKRLGND